MRLYEAIMSTQFKLASKSLMLPSSSNDFVHVVWNYFSSYMEYQFPLNSSFMECILPSLIFILWEGSFFRGFSMEEPAALIAIVDARKGQEAQMHHLATLTLPSMNCKEVFKLSLSGA
ncbi:predicted protein [Arabidopsis lyrata subsp. lyrata]|uniref:Predicted protein n=1 Tax=Arabidopsis lyrata subsp. lyrata TaxID=81972 RepID=D7MHI5_ARALL|nr:predicted protein [Arabidopsis lyrata subsp. lyrata]